MVRSAVHTANVSRAVPAILVGRVLLVSPLAHAAPPEAAASDGSAESFLTTLGELLVGGGLLMVPIALASILTLGLGIERLWALRRARIVPSDLWADVRTAVQGGHLTAARDRVAEGRTALARMLSAGLERWDEGVDALAAELDDAGQREADTLDLHLPALQGIASVAPLLGLLGTVVGMIRSFYTIAKEHVVGNPELFAEPIGQALVTTAAGLSVAIPAVVLFYWFRGRIRKHVRKLDDVARELTTLRRRAEAGA